MQSTAAPPTISRHQLAAKLDTLIFHVDDVLRADLKADQARRRGFEVTGAERRQRWFDKSRESVETSLRCSLAFFENAITVTPELERLGVDTADIFSVMNGLTDEPGIGEAWKSGLKIRLQQLADRLRAGVIGSANADKLNAVQDANRSQPVAPFGKKCLPPADADHTPAKLTIIPGGFIYQGHWEPLTGKALGILKELVEDRWKTVTLNHLQNTVWQGSLATVETVKPAICRDRKALRLAMKSACVNAPADPLPAIRGETAWKLNLP